MMLCMRHILTGDILQGRLKDLSWSACHTVVKEVRHEACVPPVWPAAWRVDASTRQRIIKNWSGR